MYNTNYLPFRDHLLMLISLIDCVYDLPLPHMLN